MSKPLPKELDDKYAEMWVKANHRELPKGAFDILTSMAMDGLITQAALRSACEKHAGWKPGTSKLVLGYVPVAPPSISKEQTDGR